MSDSAGPQDEAVCHKAKMEKRKTVQDAEVAPKSGLFARRAIRCAAEPSRVSDSGSAPRGTAQKSPANYAAP